MLLRHGIARDNFIDLPKSSVGWQPNGDAYCAAVPMLVSEAVQGGDGDIWRRHGLLLLGNGVIRNRDNADEFARIWSEQGQSSRLVLRAMASNQMKKPMHLSLYPAGCASPKLHPIEKLKKVRMS